MPFIPTQLETPLPVPDKGQKLLEELLAQTPAETNIPPEKRGIMSAIFGDAYQDPGPGAGLGSKILAGLNAGVESANRLLEGRNRPISEADYTTAEKPDIRPKGPFGVLGRVNQMGARARVAEEQRKEADEERAAKLAKTKAETEYLGARSTAVLDKNDVERYKADINLQIAQMQNATRKAEVDIAKQNADTRIKEMEQKLEIAKGEWAVDRENAKLKESIANMENAIAQEKNRITEEHNKAQEKIGMINAQANKTRADAEAALNSVLAEHVTVTKNENETFFRVRTQDGREQKVPADMMVELLKQANTDSATAGRFIRDYFKGLGLEKSIFAGIGGKSPESISLETEMQPSETTTTNKSRAKGENAARLSDEEMQKVYTEGLKPTPRAMAEVYIKKWTKNGVLDKEGLYSDLRLAGYDPENVE